MWEHEDSEAPETARDMLLSDAGDWADEKAEGSPADAGTGSSDERL